MLRLCALVLSLGLLGACATRPHPPSPRAHPSFAAIDAANRTMEVRFGANDMRGVAAMYADNALLLGPGGRRVEGREAIDAYSARPHDQPAWTLSIDRLEGDESTPIQRGRSLLSYVQDGERHVSDVQFVVIWARQDDGSYRIVVDTYWTEP